MKFSFAAAALLGASTFCLPATAAAQSVAIEGNGARAQGRWGAELGVGYNLQAGPLTVRPIAGAFLYGRDNGPDRDNETALKLYAKAEATVTLPMVAEVGAGARLSGDRMRIYGTAAMDILPRVKLKGNVGDRYLALGLMARL